MCAVWSVSGVSVGGVVSMSLRGGDHASRLGKPACYTIHVPLVCGAREGAGSSRRQHQAMRISAPRPSGGPTRLVCLLFTMAAAVPRTHSTYFGFYEVAPLQITEVHEFANIYQADSLSVAVLAAQFGLQSLLLVSDTFFAGSSLRSDWQSRWESAAAAYHPFLKNGTLLGFNLGDELVWNCHAPKDVDTMAAAVRRSFPRGDAIIWYNEAAILAKHPLKDSCGKEHDDFFIPPALDWFSVDIYHMDGPVHGFVTTWVRSYYEKYIFPRLTRNVQHALLVPGSFGSDVNHFPNGTYVCNRSCYDVMCRVDAYDYLSWAKADTRVAAVMPWNWGGCPTCNGSRWTPSHTCCMDEIGTANMPVARAAWSDVGRQLLGRTQPPRWERGGYGRGGEQRIGQ